MTDTPVTPTPEVAPVAPVVEATPVAPAVEAPVVAPAVEAPQAAPEAPVVAPVTTLLAEAPKEVAPTEAAPEAPKEEGKEPAPEAPKEATEQTKQEVQSDEPAPTPVFEAFTLPDTVQVQEATLKEFTDILGQFETDSKAAHDIVQQFGQKAVDFHLKEVQKAVSDLNTFYQKTWDETKTKWKESFLNDPEIGGNRAQTTLTTALSFLRTHGGSTEQQAEFRQLMDQSGLGNHPIMIRLLANAGRVMAEGKPLAAQAPPQVSKSRVETMYGQKKNYIS